MIVRVTIFIAAALLLATGGGNAQCIDNEIITAISHSPAEAGDTVTLSCFVSTIPGGDMISWTDQNDRPLSANNAMQIDANSRFSVSGSNAVPTCVVYNLTITNVQMSDAGTYSCRPTAGSGPVSTQTLYFGYMPAPMYPECSVTGGSTLVSTGESVEFLCESEKGNPEWTLMWQSSQYNMMSKPTAASTATSNVKTIAATINATTDHNGKVMTCFASCDDPECVDRTVRNCSLGPVMVVDGPVERYFFVSDAIQTVKERGNATATCRTKLPGAQVKWFMHEMPAENVEATQSVNGEEAVLYLTFLTNKTIANPFVCSLEVNGRGIATLSTLFTFDTVITPTGGHGRGQHGLVPTRPFVPEVPRGRPDFTPSLNVSGTWGMNNSAAALIHSGNTTQSFERHFFVSNTVQTVSEGENATATCWTTLPGAQVKWFMHETPAENVVATQSVNGEEAVLYLTFLTNNTIANPYVCSLEVDGRSISTLSTLFTFDIVDTGNTTQSFERHFFVSNAVQTVTEGENVTATCWTTLPGAQVKWFMHDTPAENVAATQSVNGEEAVLYLTFLTNKTIANPYVCSLEVDGRSISTLSTLFTFERYIFVSDAVQTVKEGENATATCWTTLPGAQVKWFMHETPAENVAATQSVNGEEAVLYLTFLTNKNIANPYVCSLEVNGQSISKLSTLFTFDTVNTPTGGHGRGLGPKRPFVSQFPRGRPDFTPSLNASGTWGMNNSAAALIVNTTISTANTTTMSGNATTSNATATNTTAPPTGANTTINATTSNATATTPAAGTTGAQAGNTTGAPNTTQATQGMSQGMTRGMIPGGEVTGRFHPTMMPRTTRQWWKPRTDSPAIFPAQTVLPPRPTRVPDNRPRPSSAAMTPQPTLSATGSGFLDILAEFFTLPVIIGVAAVGGLLILVVIIVVACVLTSRKRRGRDHDCEELTELAKRPSKPVDSETPTFPAFGRGSSTQDLINIGNEDSRRKQQNASNNKANGRMEARSLTANDLLSSGIDNHGMSDSIL